MAAAYRQGFVFVQNIFAGVVSETDSGYKFEYDKDYLSVENPLAVSLTLPLQKETFESSSRIALIRQRKISFSVIDVRKNEHSFVKPKATAKPPHSIHLFRIQNIQQIQAAFFFQFLYFRFFI